MAKSFKEVNWFRLLIVTGLSIATSMSFFYADENLTRAEIFNSLFQAAIVGFSFLQCPEGKSRAELARLRNRRADKTATHRRGEQ